MNRLVLIGNGFDLAHDYYLVYEFDTAKSQNYPNLPSLARGKQTTSPYFATWEVLTEKKEQKEKRYA